MPAGIASRLGPRPWRKPYKALSAVLFLYKEVMAVEIGAVQAVVRARTPDRLPVVLSREEIGAILKRLTGTDAAGRHAALRI